VGAPRQRTSLFLLEMVSMIELVLYRTRAQMEEEKEELAIADELTSL
jgi:hypothetical protein